MLRGSWWKAVLAALVLASAAPAVQAEMIQFDFKEKSDAKRWTSLRGDWYIYLRGYTARQEKNPTYSLATTIYSKRQFSDVSIKYTTESKLNDNTSFVWLRSSYKKNGKYYEISGYRVIVTSQPNYDYIFAEIDIVKNLLLGGNRRSDTTNICSSYSFDPSFNDHEITVDVKGDEIKVMHKGKLICSAKDMTFKRGYVGFSVQNQSSSQIISIRRATINWPG